MLDFLKPLIRKSPKNIILHVGTNNTPNKTSRRVLNKLLTLKSYIEKQLHFFHFCITWGNNLGPKITSLTIVFILKSSPLKYVRLNNVFVYGTNYPLGFVLLTILRVGFSHLRKHKYRNVSDVIDMPNAIVTTEH